MLQVLLVFFYMGVTCFILGYGVLSLITGGRYHIHHRLSYLMAGVVCATVYAEVFSIFAPVGPAANVILLILCAFTVWCFRGQITKRLNGYLPAHRIWLLYILLAAVFAYGTSHGIMHYDTGLYHAQSIRLCEEYGVIKGAANLHSRFGYNNSIFPLSALYSFSFLGGRSVHACAGFFALLLAYACLDIGHILRRGRPVITELVRLAGIYYLFNIFKEMVSPASDYFLNCFLFCILILWVDRDVHREKNYIPYALLAVAAVFTVTVKLSAAPLVLLAIKPVAMIVSGARSGNRQGAMLGMKDFPPKARAAVTIAVFVLLGVLAAAPYLVRNYLISGWLLYPSTTPDLFNAAWKLPHDLAEGDAAWIRATGRGTWVTEAGQQDPAITQWFPAWFASQTKMSKLLVIADVLTAAAYPLCIVFYLIRRRKRRMSGGADILRMSGYILQEGRDFVFLEGVLLISLAFWFFQAPMVRYGFFLVWSPTVIMAGMVLLYFFRKLSDSKAAGITAKAALVLAAFLLYKGVRLVMTDTTLMKPEYLFAQQDYETFAVVPYDVSGVTMYYPAEGDRTGYYGFPGGPFKADITLMGDDIRDGIMPSGERAAE